MRIKILTFNMQFGKVWDTADPDGAPVRLEDTIAELKKHGADIVHLQEVEKVEPVKNKNRHAPNYERIRRELADYDGYFSYPAADERELPFGYGLAILSKPPLYDQEAVHLPAPPIEFEFGGRTTSPTQRLLIGAKTKTGGHEIQLYNTHLQAFFMVNSNSDDHPGQREIVARLLRSSKIPTILTGDFNAAPQENTIRELEKTGFHSAQKNQPTWKRMPYVLDHVFYNGPLRLKNCQVNPTAASDHEILTAEFAIA